MPSISPSEGLAFWFTNLRQFQVACINTSAFKMDLLAFANSTVADDLPTPAEKKNFVIAARVSTGFDDMDPSDLTTYKTFAGLLNNWNSLPTAIFVLLQSLASPALQGVPSKVFMKATIANAFPSGSAGPGWTQVLAALKSNTPAICFTAAFQTQVNATVDKAGSKVGELISQIAVLG